MSIKSIDLNDKQMRFLPIAGNTLEITAATKNKNATLEIRVPDEMYEILKDMMMGEDVTAYQLLVTYRIPEEK